MTFLGHPAQLIHGHVGLVVHDHGALLVHGHEEHAVIVNDQARTHTYN